MNPLLILLSFAVMWPAMMLWIGLLARLIILVLRLRLHFGGPDAAVKAKYSEVDEREADIYSEAGSRNCPAYDALPLPRSGGTFHLPRARSEKGWAILQLPGKGRTFNLFPLQKKLKDLGIPIDIVGVDYCAYGAGFERNVREKWFPRFLYEMRVNEFTHALVEALQVTKGTYNKVLVVANSTAGVSMLELLSKGSSNPKVCEALSVVQGVWLTNPVVAWKDGHFVNTAVNSPVPNWLMMVLDQVMGLGPVLLEDDPSKGKWFYYSDEKKKVFRECFATAEKPDGIMVGVPRYQQVANPMRLMHIAEIMRVRRAWKAGAYTRGKFQASSGAAWHPPIWFSLNYREDEWHCGAKEAKQLLDKWGAEEVGDIDTHEEFLYGKVSEWEKSFAVLKGLSEKAFGLSWK